MAGAAPARRPAIREATLRGRRGLDEELRAVAAPQAQERRRAEQVGRRPPTRASSPRSSARTARRAGGSRARDDDANEVAERRIAELAPALELAGEELLHVVARGERDRARVRLVGLHDHAARARRGRCGRRAASRAGRCAPPRGSRGGRAPCRRRRRRRARRPGSGGPCATICVPSRTPRSQAAKPARTSASLPGLAGDVGVEPEALQLRQALGQLGLELLRAGAEARHLGGAAGGAELGRGLAAPAVVAVEPPVPVEGERDVAVGAAERQPAGAAVERGRRRRGG